MVVRNGADFRCIVSSPTWLCKRNKKQKSGVEQFLDALQSGERNGRDSRHMCTSPRRARDRGTRLS